MRLRAIAIALVAAGVTAACGGNDSDSASPPTPSSTTVTAAGDPPGTAPAAPDPTSPPPADLDAVRVRLTRVATVDQPVALAVRSGDDALYVVEKGGRVRTVRDGQVSPDPVLDISGSVSTGSEQGLLGLAFSPEGNRIYVNYTDNQGDTRVVEYGFVAGRADPDSRRELLFVDQPFANHNGGNLVFGPDRMLWIGLGDGGSQGDPRNNAQSTDRLLGKMLRIDPAPGGDRPYTIPPDNPYASGGGRPEIWAFGLRNPWRYSFDRATGDLWIGDVGGSQREEIDFQPAGAGRGHNYGWPLVEGTRRNKGAPPPGAVAPIKDYARGDGNCAVTGGYVYRGSRIPGLVGAYLYGDYCGGRVRALTQAGGRVTAERDLDLEVPSLTSFGEDGAGELYALSQEGPLYRIDPA